jgi:hypothetical protein
MNSPPPGSPARMPTPPLSHSLARLLHDYAARWEIERVERSTEWVAVLGDTSGDYIRIIGAHDIGALRHKMDEAERDEPEERKTTGTR